jgi:isopentenyldiphosphate isomerase
MTTVAEEILDVVDSNDQVIESLPRSEVYKRGDCIIRGCWLFIQNSKGQLWIPRRAKTKSLFPDALDGSAVGHVSAGETYEEAAIRETEEEVGIKLKPEELVCIGRMGPDQLAAMNNRTRAFIKVYLLKSDETPEFDKSEYSEYYWLTPEEIIKRIDAGDKHKSSLPFIIKYLFLN